MLRSREKLLENLAGQFLDLTTASDDQESPLTKERCDGCRRRLRADNEGHLCPSCQGKFDDMEFGGKGASTDEASPRKLAQNLNSDLTGTIERASDRPMFNIPNFRRIISAINAQDSSKAIKTLTITMNVKSPSEVEVAGVSVTPMAGSVASVDDIPAIVSGLKTSIPAYFSKYGETINNIYPGSYVANYDFEQPAVATK